MGAEERTSFLRCGRFPTPDVRAGTPSVGVTSAWVMEETAQNLAMEAGGYGIYETWPVDDLFTHHIYIYIYVYMYIRIYVSIYIYIWM